MPALRNGEDHELHRLEQLAGENWYSSFGPTAQLIRHATGIFRRHFRKGSCLELGSAEGLMTDLLVGEFADLTVVEASSSFCDQLRSRYPSITVCNALIETFAPSRTYENIVMNNVLEHVEDPQVVLKAVRSWLAPGGAACIAVPNVFSLHRQIGVIMGLLAEEHQLNDTDRRNGHRRVYDTGSFRHEFEAAGLHIEASGGYWLKMISDRQMQDGGWSEELLDACLVLGSGTRRWRRTCMRW